MQPHTALLTAPRAQATAHLDAKAAPIACCGPRLLCPPTMRAARLGAGIGQPAGQRRHGAGPQPRHSGPRLAATAAAASSAGGGSSSGFAEVKRDAESDYRKARDLLPTLETASSTASKARRPAAEAESVWQDSHRRLSVLSEEVGASLARLRDAVAEAAGGGPAATAQLVRHHIAARMKRARTELEGCKEWQVGVPRVAGWGGRGRRRAGVAGAVCGGRALCSARRRAPLPTLFGCTALGDRAAGGPVDQAARASLLPSPHLTRTNSALNRPQLSPSLPSCATPCRTLTRWRW